MDKVHSAWHITEIRQPILEHLDHQSLARLGQTCHSYFDLVVDNLWRTVDSIEAFLCALPPNHLYKPLRRKDIERLDWYASKVQRLTLQTANPTRDVIRLPPHFLTRNRKKLLRPKPKSWEELWEEVAKLRPTSNFLPNLQYLRFNGVAEILLLPFIGITGANLTSLYFKYIHDKQPNQITSRLLEQFHETPFLAYLFVRDGEPDIIPLKLIQSSALVHLRLDPRIRHDPHQDPIVKEFPMRTEILQHAKLENLTIGLTQDWYSPNFKKLDRKYLPALKSLWLILNTFRHGNCWKACTHPERETWTSGSESFDGDRDAGHESSCLRRSPTLFIEGLDSPKLTSLNIRFNFAATGKMLIDVVAAAKRSCRLQDLTELALAGGGWVSTCSECYYLPAPLMYPKDLRTAMRMLIPMPQLKVLRLSAAPNFLDVLDLDLYQTITSGLPKLETLRLGHDQFYTGSAFNGMVYHERVPLKHLAAFCSMLPELLEVSVGTMDGLLLEEKPTLEWACPCVERLAVSWWAGRASNHSRDVPKGQAMANIRAYFPNSNLAITGFDPLVYGPEQSRALCYNSIDYERM